MRFTRGDWTHEGFKDVFIEVVKVSYQNSSKAVLKVNWWNLGWVGRPHCIQGLVDRMQGKPSTLTIRNFAGWQRLKSRVRTIKEVA